ncbi:MAG: hypothetical protein ACLP7P_20680 [Rhodomicrobium sp.]
MQVKYLLIAGAAMLGLSLCGQAAYAGAGSLSGVAGIEKQAATQTGGELTLVFRRGGWGHRGWGGRWGGGGWGWGAPWVYGAPCYYGDPYCGYPYGYYGGGWGYGGRYYRGYRGGYRGGHGHMHHHH